MASKVRAVRGPAAPAELPRLVGVTEIGGMIGVVKQRAWWWTTRPGFPPPAAELSRGRLWSEAEVQAWIDTNAHRLGRSAPMKLQAERRRRRAPAEAA